MLVFLHIASLLHTLQCENHFRQAAREKPATIKPGLFTYAITHPMQREASDHIRMDPNTRLPFRVFPFAHTPPRSPTLPLGTTQTGKTAGREGREFEHWWGRAWRERGWSPCKPRLHYLAQVMRALSVEVRPTATIPPRPPSPQRGGSSG